MLITSEQADVSVLSADCAVPVEPEVVVVGVGSASSPEQATVAVQARVRTRARVAREAFILISIR